MAGVHGEQRAAARLRHVADEEPAPAISRRLLGQLFDELDQRRVAPVAVARERRHGRRRADCLHQVVAGGLRPWPASLDTRRCVAPAAPVC